MTHPQIARALRLMNMEKNGTPTAAEFEALLADQGRLDACIELMRRPGALGQIAGYPSLYAALMGTDAALSLVLSSAPAMAEAAKNPTAMLAFINSQSALDTIFANPAAAAAFMASTALAKASVPNMTSNTAPSGVASASSNYGYGFAPWMMFDKTAQHWGVQPDLLENQWLQYKFAQGVFIHTATLTNWDPSYSPKDCRVEYSDDGVNFEPAAVVTLNTNTNQTIGCAVAGFHKYWRLFMVNVHVNPAIMAELNFTGFVAP